MLGVSRSEPPPEGDKNKKQGKRKEDMLVISTTEIRSAKATWGPQAFREYIRPLRPLEMGFELGKGGSSIYCPTTESKR